MNTLPLGCIVFQAERKNWISDIIRVATKSQFAHTFITLEDGSVLEANAVGVERSSLLKYMGVDHHLEAFKMPFSQEEIERALESIIKKYLGKPYGFLQLVHILFALSSNITRLPLISSYTDKGIICGELIRYYCDELDLSKQIPSFQSEWSSPSLITHEFAYSSFKQVHLLLPVYATKEYDDIQWKTRESN